MDFRKKRISIDEAREIDLVHFVAELGFEPAKIMNNDYWYLSPLRDEKKPSFKINRRINRWYDHGIGRGGNVIDFAIEYYHCTIGELLDRFSSHYSFQQPAYRQVRSFEEPQHKINIVKQHGLASMSLLQYLKQRRIPLNIADDYCREVRYELNGKIYYGIGFKNDIGGFEIRNPYFKASSSPKGITTIGNNSNEVMVFEGFMDFLSFKTIHRDQSNNSSDFVVLNSLSFFETARPFAENHDKIRLFLDRDTAGQNCTRYALSLGSRYVDESSLYQNHKDLNEWLISAGTPKNKRPRLKPK